MYRFRHLREAEKPWELLIELSGGQLASTAHDKHSGPVMAKRRSRGSKRAGAQPGDAGSRQGQTEPTSLAPSVPEERVYSWESQVTHVPAERMFSWESQVAQYPRTVPPSAPAPARVPSLARSRSCLPLSPPVDTLAALLEFLYVSRIRYLDKWHFGNESPWPRTATRDE
jgi:hypothetical protein